MFVFMDSSGRYYKAEARKNDSDCSVPHVISDFAAALPDSGESLPWAAIKEIMDKDTTKPQRLFPSLIAAFLLGASLLLSAINPAAAQTSDAINPSSLPGNVVLNYQWNGATWDRVRIPNIFKSINSVSVATETTVWTPASGKKFRFMGFCLSSGTVGSTLVVKDNTAGSTILVTPFIFSNATTCAPVGGNGLLSAAANNVLTVTGVATQTLAGFFYGTEE